MNRIKMLALLIVMLLTAFDCSAASLWLSGKDLYSAKGARDFIPGDIVTIVVSENATAQSGATTQTQKDSTMEVTSGPQIPFLKKIVNQFVGKNETKVDFNGNGTTTRVGKLSGTITATVLEVMSNGNLLIEGSRSIRVNRETQIMRVRGVARPQDIDATNSVDSKLLADAQIKFDGKGSVGRVNNPGLITKFMNTIF